jgi:hypothetical protein
MELPHSAELNELNRIVIAVSELSDQGQACSVDSVLKLCSSIVLGGRPADHSRMLRLCSYAGLLSVEKGIVSLTELGQEFLSHNSDSSYEITDAQMHFFAEKAIFNGPWQSRARDLFLSFSPNYSDITYELSMIDNPLPVRHNSTVYLLRVLGVLVETEGKLSVSPIYVASVRQLLAYRNSKTQEELEQALQADRRLAEQAEEAVVEYERKRLKALGCEAEAELVRRISQLDVGAGYDIQSFDGDKPLFDYDRFIEVKVSQGTELRFYWSVNECRVAEEKGDNYWIYFVGGFQHNRGDQIEPIMIQNLAKRISQLPQLVIEVEKYVVTQRDELPLRPVHPQSIKGFVL